MAQDFGERLKRYRKEKNLTQQDLADRLGVSNKTVSRWESGGGYPDVPLLVPLARALGVSVDDLLDDEKPVRAFSRREWQNLLSFAFAIGGGILFFLLRLFVPIPVCYLVYLGCLAYGTYLQRYHCYRSKWFLLYCAIMSFCVYMALILSILAIPMFLRWFQDAMLPYFWIWQVIGGCAAAVLLSAVLTAMTIHLVSHFGLEGKALPRYRLRLEKPPFFALLPALGSLLLAGFYGLYLNPNLPMAVQSNQRYLYYGLLAGLTLLFCPLSLKKERQKGLLTTAVMALGGLCLPPLTAQFAWLPNKMIFVEATDNLSQMYTRIGCASLPMAVVAAALCALILLLAFVRPERVGKGAE